MVRFAVVISPGIAIRFPRRSSSRQSERATTIGPYPSVFLHGSLPVAVFALVCKRAVHGVLDAVRPGLADMAVQTGHVTVLADQREFGIVIEMHGGGEVALVVTARAIGFTLAELTRVGARVARGTGFRRRLERERSTFLGPEQVYPTGGTCQILVACHAGDRPVRTGQSVTETLVLFGTHGGRSEGMRYVAGIAFVLELGLVRIEVTLSAASFDACQCNAGAPRFGTSGQRGQIQA